MFTSYISPLLFHYWSLIYGVLTYDHDTMMSFFPAPPWICYRIFNIKDVFESSRRRWKPFPFRRCLFGQKCQVSEIIVSLPLLFQWCIIKVLNTPADVGEGLGGDVDLICWLKCSLRSCYCCCYVRHLWVCFHLSSLCTWFCVVWAPPLQLITPQTHPTWLPRLGIVFSSRLVSRNASFPARLSPVLIPVWPQWLSRCWWGQSAEGGVLTLAASRSLSQ